MKSERIKIERLLLIVAALVLCALLAVRVTFAWFAANTSKMTIVTGDADLDVTFYRLRDFNRDGAYDYNDYVKDGASDFAHFADLTAALLAALGGGADAITADNFAAAYAALSDADVMAYTYETDFTKAVADVRMGSQVTYRVRVTNNSARAADAALSFGNLMKYYYNAAQMLNYKNNAAIDRAIGGAGGDNIENYSAKFLFSVVRTETAEDGAVSTVSMPLWSAAQSETVTVKRVAAGATADLDFLLAFDGRSVAGDYLDYVTNAAGECYRECLGIAKTLDGVTDAAAFTSAYLRAVYEEEMTYLFSSPSGSGTVAADVNLKLDFIQIAGTLVGQVAS